MKKLSIKDKATALKKLKGWKLVKGRNAITKKYKFHDFQSAITWMLHIALYAEKINHHPEWFNVYNNVEVVLSTHDVGGVSNLDIDLAKKMNSTFKKGS